MFTWEGRFKDIPLTAVRKSGFSRKFGTLEATFERFIHGLDQMIGDLDRYTDLPLQERLYVEDIDSFRKVRDINPQMVASVLDNGRFNRSEERFS